MAEKSIKRTETPQAREDGSLDHGSDVGNGKKWLDFISVLSR